MRAAGIAVVAAYVAGVLALVGLSASELWLANGTNFGADGLGEYEVSVDRYSLPPGIYSARINAQSSVNNLEVQVLVSAGGVDADNYLFIYGSRLGSLLICRG